MYDIFINTHFAGAHHLRDYPGDCEKPHGHNWKIRVTVRAMEVDELGMGIDFKILKKKVNAIVDELDHQDLNELPAFQDVNPSSEHIAAFLFAKLQPELLHDRYSLYSVEVWETENSGLIFYGPDARP
ncbi:MAG: 6-carboxytetrahydropterin synthase QueD [Proteobacteria bacterium]|nr:6-carboxytetrahydropterin synthase QueD [Pseudomonadota bacterium]MBU1059265.1 6-carboxytetrahydropterin synthase QueD [Pseudomonadota bacterium]